MTTISLEKVRSEYRVKVGTTVENPIDSIQVPPNVAKLILSRAAPTFYIQDIGGVPDSDKNARYLFKFIIHKLSGYT